MHPLAQAIFEKGMDFGKLRDQIWDFQLRNNPVIARFCEMLGTKSPTFIPISFFRDFEMLCQLPEQETNPGKALIFDSSGTTGQRPSRHLVPDPQLYQESLMRGFRHFYGPGRFTIFALLPGYLERGNSSLVHMVHTWVRMFGEEGSGFFLHDHAALSKGLSKATEAGRNILLIGVSHALLDFAAAYPMHLPENTIVMETGGMKGKREEMVRDELHAELSHAFGLEKVHSEYGMTELLSQAYAQGGSRFRCPPWMRITITDPYVPDRPLPPGQTGRINVTDLANLWSCAFIRTDDIGRAHSDGSFEVLGRLDHAELRGCNLMYA